MLKMKKRAPIKDDGSSLNLCGANQSRKFVVEFSNLGYPLISVT